MILLFFLCLLTYFTTTNAVDIVAIQNQSDTPATISFVQKEGLDCERVLIASIKQNSKIVLEKKISIPYVLYQFNNIQEEVTEYLEIQTKKGMFFCVEGELIETTSTGKYGFCGLWLEKQRKNPQEQIYCRILSYSKGLCRFGTPAPSQEKKLPIRHTQSTPDIFESTKEDPYSTILIIDSKGNIYTDPLA